MRVLEQKIDPSLMNQLDEQCEVGNLSSDEDEQFKNEVNGDQGLSKDGKFTISQISSALGMNKEEKTMSRVLAELKKNNPRL